MNDLALNECDDKKLKHAIKRTEEVREKKANAKKKVAVPLQSKKPYSGGRGYNNYPVNPGFFPGNSPKPCPCPPPWVCRAYGPGTVYRYHASGEPVH